MSGGRELAARVAAVKARVGLAGVIGRRVKLVRRGREFSGLCPFHQERSPSFTVVEDKGFYHCFGCGAHGDVLSFVMESEGCDFAGALQRLESDAGLEGTARPALQRESRKAGIASALIEGRRAAAWAWQAGRSARGSGLGEAWLRSRGIDPAANGFLDVARFVPDCPAALWRADGDPRDVRRRAPALVAPILRVGGGRGARELVLAGVHVTFLRGDGGGKAAFATRGDGSQPPARVMWGVAARGGVPVPAAPAPVGLDSVADWLSALIDADGPLVVGEGLESTQSLLARVPGARMGWATLSLGNLEGVPVKDGPKGALPLHNLRGEAELGLPFTIADPGAVVVGVDADMKPLKDRMVQERPRGPAFRRDISGAERALICAALAGNAWRRAGASGVAVARPPAGADFNDLDREAVHG